MKTSSGSPAPPHPGSPWTVATINIAEETEPEAIIQGLEKADPIGRADVFLLQEVLHSSDELSLPMLLAKRLRFHLAFAPGDSLVDGTTRGVAILSRFPVRDPQTHRLKEFNLRFKSRCRVALAVTVESPQGPIRVVNIHLDSRINAKERLDQLDPVVARLVTFAGPQVIGGDFNTSNVLWWRRWLPLPFLSPQSGEVRRLMESQGFTTPFTSTGRTFSYLPLRSDWVFLNGLRSVGAGIEPIPFSDHRALWVKLLDKI